MKKILIKTFIILFLTLIITIPLYSLNSTEHGVKPRAINGILDLINWNWDEDGIITLDGQWEFYWQKLYYPEDFEKLKVRRKQYISLPGAWNNYLIDNEEIKSDGYATYRILIRHSTNQILGLKIPRIFTSYKLWVNGELMAAAGQTNRNKQAVIPQYLPQTIYFNPDMEPTELVIQVSNFHHRSGGILESITIGRAAEINNLHMNNLGLELFLFGSLFIIGFYHIMLFIFRTKDKSTFYFGLYSLLISARTLLVGEIFFIHLFPDFNWEIAHKVQTLSYYLGVPLIILFLKTIFPKDTSKKVNLFIQVFSAIFILLVLLTPVRIFSLYNPIYQVFSFIVFIYAIYIIIISCYKKREGAYFIGFGVLILILFTINDIIFHSIILANSSEHFLRNFINRGNLSSWGLLIFMFTQSLVLAKKSSNSFKDVESLTEELKQTNINLEEKVKNRTLALENSKEKLKKAYQAVSQSEKSLQDLMQNISHDLRTPLSAIKGYTNAILDDIVKKPEQKEKYLKKIIEKSNYMNHMVQELFDLSQMEAGQMRLELKPISIKKFIKNISKTYKIDMINKNVLFNIYYPSIWGNYKDLDSIFLLIDIERLERVFNNLLDNAVKYRSEKAQIELYYKLIDNKKKLLVKISDNGIGISAEDSKHIFQRFYRVSKARQKSKSNGLGLAIAKEIIEYHGGQIWVESKINKGSDFFFTLPLHHKNNK